MLITEILITRGKSTYTFHNVVLNIGGLVNQVIERHTYLVCFMHALCVFSFTSVMSSLDHPSWMPFLRALWYMTHVSNDTPAVISYMAEVMLSLYESND